MKMFVKGTDNNGNPIDALTNPDTIKELEDYLTEMNHRPVQKTDVNEMERYLRDRRAIHVSRSMRDTAYHAMRTREELTIRLNREPTIH